MPLLGVSNIPLFYEPAEPGAIYMLGSAILQHSQVWTLIDIWDIIKNFTGYFHCRIILFSQWRNPKRC